MRYEKQSKEMIEALLKHYGLKKSSIMPELIELVNKIIEDTVDEECEKCERIDPSDYVPEPSYNYSELD